MWFMLLVWKCDKIEIKITFLSNSSNFIKSFSVFITFYMQTEDKTCYDKNKWEAAYMCITNLSFKHNQLQWTIADYWKSLMSRVINFTDEHTVAVDVSVHDR